MPKERSISDQNHEYFMKQALEQAQLAAQQGEVPVGALIVDAQGQVLAQAYNKKEGGASALAHAEVLAIGQASQKLGQWRLSGCTMYVTLEPCPMCAGAIWSSRIDKVVFGAMDPKAGYMGSLYNLAQDQRLNHQIEVIPNVLKNECSQILKDFFKNLRTKNKKPETGSTGLY